MSSSTTLVNIDAEAAQKLASFIASKLSGEDSASYLATCETHIQKQQASELINKFLEKSTVILSLDSDDEVEGTFQALFSVLYILGDEQAAESPVLIKSIIDNVTSDVKTTIRRRLNALVVLFNLILSGSLKYDILIAIYSYAKATNQSALIQSFHDQVLNWVGPWKLTVDQQRTLYRTIAVVLQENNSGAAALNFTVQYLRCGSGNVTTAEDNELLIKPSLLYAIRSPIESYQQRMTFYEAITSIKLTEQLTLLQSLLRILCDGSVAEFAAFAKTNAALFTEHNLDLAAREREIKILAICSLAAQATKKTIAYSTIACALQVSEEEVEMWVIEAIAANAINGSIDQLQGVVAVTRYAQRSFGVTQWQSLQAKLKEVSKQIAATLDQLDGVQTLV